jgi:peroxiredoxin (alkyl hydroperoxide reductase subunit C)
MCTPIPTSSPANATAAGRPSIPRIGDPAPDFTALTTHGEIRFKEWQGNSWVLLFSHPADFTPVCSTELTELARRSKEFEARNFKLIGVSVDSIHSHLAWVQNLQQILDTKLSYPLVADSTRAVSELYGMIHPGESATVTVRALFFIDPKHTIRAVIYYPLNVGRSVDEILRVVDALQTADTNGVACPVNWKKGDKVIVPPPKSEKEVAARLAMSGVERLDFYLIRKTL